MECLWAPKIILGWNTSHQKHQACDWREGSLSPTAWLPEEAGRHGVCTVCAMKISNVSTSETTFLDLFLQCLPSPWYLYPLSCQEGSLASLKIAASLCAPSPFPSSALLSRFHCHWTRMLQPSSVWDVVSTDKYLRDRNKRVDFKPN